ncbi:CFAD factor, partial [Amia calva]|nr:CFAD factor [Amia calva]
MASIQKNGTHFCGGFLVAKQWVMTPLERRSRVVLGAHSLSRPEGTKQISGIAECHLHPHFSEENYDNDIALLKLDSPVTLTPAVRPVQVQRGGGNLPEGQQCSTAGWGWITNYHRLPMVLQEVSVTVISQHLCGRSDYYGDQLTRNMMCAATCPSNSRKLCQDACRGDSGGPLIHKGVVVGITSTGGKKCGKPKKPGVYTVVSHYTQWIDSILQQ